MTPQTSRTTHTLNVLLYCLTSLAESGCLFVSIDESGLIIAKRISAQCFGAPHKVSACLTHLRTQGEPDLLQDGTKRGHARSEQLSEKLWLRGILWIILPLSCSIAQVGSVPSDPAKWSTFLPSCPASSLCWHRREQNDNYVCFWPKSPPLLHSLMEGNNSSSRLAH